MTLLKEFTMSSARPLPVLLLADISGSMASDGKIQSLNHAMHKMISTFAQEDDLRAEIHVGVVTFGGTQAQQHLAIGPAKQVTWSDLPASGSTPMGSAFRLATQIVEDRALDPKPYIRPRWFCCPMGSRRADEWKASLDTLLRVSAAARRSGWRWRSAQTQTRTCSRRSSTTRRRGSSGPTRRAKSGSSSRLVTMSVTSRSRSQNPNAAPPTAAAGAKLPADEGWDLLDAARARGIGARASPYSRGAGEPRCVERAGRGAWRTSSGLRWHGQQAARSVSGRFRRWRRHVARLGHWVRASNSGRRTWRVSLKCCGDSG